MKIIRNEITGMYVVPCNHPVTVANPAPWLVNQIKIEINPLKVWIRHEGENKSKGSMWFRADQCFIGPFEEVMLYLKSKSKEN